MPPGPDADLRWTAHLYALGELAPGEEADFERRLADDQAAREAVAGAVELLGTLAALDPRDWHAPRRPRRPALLAWAGLAAAACLAVATLAAYRGARVEPAADPAAIAAAWSGLRESEPIGAEVDGLDLPDEPAAPDPSAAPALPSWLQAAAAPARPDEPRPEEN